MGEELGRGPFRLPKIARIQREVTRPASSCLFKPRTTTRWDSPAKLSGAIGATGLLLLSAVGNLVRKVWLIRVRQINDAFGHGFVQPHRHALQSAENDAIAGLVLVAKDKHSGISCYRGGLNLGSRDSRPLRIFHFNMKRSRSLTASRRRRCAPSRRSRCKGYGIRDRKKER